MSMKPQVHPYLPLLHKHNSICFLQVAISATENREDLMRSSQKTMTLRYAMQHTSGYMIIFVSPVKALWWPKAYPNFGLNLAVHLWQQRIFDCVLTTLLYWQVSCITQLNPIWSSHSDWQKYLETPCVTVNGNVTVSSHYQRSQHR